MLNGLWLDRNTTANSKDRAMTNAEARREGFTQGVMAERDHVLCLMQVGISLDASIKDLERCVRRGESALAFHKYMREKRAPR